MTPKQGTARQSSQLGRATRGGRSTRATWKAETAGARDRGSRGLVKRMRLELTRLGHMARKQKNDSGCIIDHQTTMASGAVRMEATVGNGFEGGEGYDR